MKNSISVVLFSLAISLFTFGLQAAEDEHNRMHSNHGSAVTTSGLSLNNGDRWEMDDHTRRMSSKMKVTFFDADHSDQASLNALGVQLETQMNELIKGCTMSGEAHDQLHLFLADHVPTIQNLAKADDYDTARKLAIKLKGNYETYTKHFK